MLHLPYPYNWPLMPPGDPFRDFYLYRERFSFFHTRQFFTYPLDAYLYPAPPALIYRFFFLFSNATEIFLAALCATFVAAVCLLGRALLIRRVNLRAVLMLIATAVICSYPFFFDFEQANIEWVGCALVGLGIWAFLQKRAYTAALCFGIAGSLKLYPLIFIALLLSRRQYRQAAVAVAVASVSTLLSLWMLCPDLSFAWHGIGAGLNTFREFYVLHYQEVGFDHSAFALFKALSLLVFAAPLTPPTLALCSGIYLSVAAFAGILVYFDVIRRLPLLNQVLCLAAATVLLPPVSYDYTLLQLYIPWALLLLAFANRDRPVPGLIPAFVCFAVIFAPETEFIFHGQSYGGQIKALALAALAIIALRHPFRSSFDAEPASAEIIQSI